MDKKMGSLEKDLNELNVLREKDIQMKLANPENPDGSSVNQIEKMKDSLSQENQRLKQLEVHASNHPSSLPALYALVSMKDIVLVSSCP